MSGSSGWVDYVEACLDGQADTVGRFLWRSAGITDSLDICHEWKFTDDKTGIGPRQEKWSLGTVQGEALLKALLAWDSAETDGRLTERIMKELKP